MTLLVDVFKFLDQLGLVDVIIPFVLAYTIIFAVLERSRVLGTEKGLPKRKLNALVAFCTSFFFVAAINLVQASTAFLQWIAVATIFSIFVLAFAKFLSGKTAKESKEGFGMNFSAGIALIIVLVIALYSLGFKGFVNLRFIEGIVPAVIGLGIVILLLYFIMREKKPKAAQKPAQQQPPERQELTPEMIEELQKKQLERLKKLARQNPVKARQVLRDNGLPADAIERFIAAAHAEG